MSRALASIKRGLEQAIAHQEGRPVKIRVHRIPDIDVKAIREKTGLTRLEFAAKFAVSPGTLRHWERGDRTTCHSCVACNHSTQPVQQIQSSWSQFGEQRARRFGQENVVCPPFRARAFLDFPSHFNTLYV